MMFSMYFQDNKAVQLPPMDQDDEEQVPCPTDSMLSEPLLQYGLDAPLKEEAGLRNQAPAWSCVAVLANTMLGAGVIGGPHAMAQLGSLLGACILLLSVSLSANGLHLLCISAESVKKRPASFYTLCKVAIPRFTFLIDLAIAIKCFGVAVSYLVVVGDLMPLVFEGNGNDVLAARWFWVTLAFVITIPLTFARSLTALKYTSSLSVSFVITLAVVCLLYTSGALEPCGGKASQPQTCRGERVTARWGLDALEAFPVYIFAFTCHQNVFCLVNELRKPTPRRVVGSIAWSAGIASLANLVIGEAAYAAYGANISSDILATFPHSKLSTVLRVLISILVTFAFPLQAHPARTCILALVREGLGEASGPSSSTHRFHGVTIGFLLAAYAIALSVKDLSVMLEVVGATGSTIVSYLLPGLLYYKLHPVPHLRRHVALLQFALGCVIIPTCLTITVRKHL